MKAFLFMLMFNPEQGHHMHREMLPLEMKSMQACVGDIAKATEYFKDKVKEDFVIGCVEAPSSMEAAKIILDKANK